MSREHVLHKVRTALGRSAGQPVEEPPPVRLTRSRSRASRRASACFCARIEALAGKTHRAASAEDARAYVARVIAGRKAQSLRTRPFCANAASRRWQAFESGITDRARAARTLCATAACGITSADYALADTGTLVMLASPQEARLISLLPPVHIAIVERERLLTGLDELLSILPRPAEQTSSMVLITGPSRTADIEQILVRGVHGPGEIHVVVV